MLVGLDWIICFEAEAPLNSSLILFSMEMDSAPPKQSIRPYLSSRRREGDEIFRSRTSIRVLFSLWSYRCSMRCHLAGLPSESLMRDGVLPGLLAATTLTCPFQRPWLRSSICSQQSKYLPMSMPAHSFHSFQSTINRTCPGLWQSASILLQNGLEVPSSSGNLSPSLSRYEKATL